MYLTKNMQEAAFNRYLEGWSFEQFGLKHPTEWLKRQAAHAEGPTLAKWSELLSGYANKPSAHFGDFISKKGYGGETIPDLIKSLGCPVSVLSDDNLRDVMLCERRDIGSIGGLLRSAQYCYCGHGFAYLSNDSGLDVVLRPVDHLTGGVFGYGENLDLLSADLANSMAMAWKYGGPHDSNLAQRAKELLCEWFAGIVSEVEEQARCEFKKAVAVIGDGKKTIRADWVIFGDKDTKRCLVYPGSVFAERKIQIPQEALISRDRHVKRGEGTQDEVPMCVWTFLESEENAVLSPHDRVSNYAYGQVHGARGSDDSMLLVALGLGDQTLGDPLAEWWLRG